MFCRTLKSMRSQTSSAADSVTERISPFRAAPCHNTGEHRAREGKEADPAARGGSFVPEEGIETARAEPAGPSNSPVIDRLLEDRHRDKIYCRLPGVNSPGYYKHQNYPISPTIVGLPGPEKGKRLSGVATAEDLVHRKFH